MFTAAFRRTEPPASSIVLALYAGCLVQLVYIGMIGEGRARIHRRRTGSVGFQRVVIVLGLSVLILGSGTVLAGVSCLRRRLIVGSLGRSGCCTTGLVGGLWRSAVHHRVRSNGALERLRGALGTLTDATWAAFFSQAVGLSLLTTGRGGLGKEIGQLAFLGRGHDSGRRRGDRRWRRISWRLCRLGDCCRRGASSFGDRPMGG